MPMDPVKFEDALRTVYNNMRGSTILGAWRVEHVPDCLVLRPVTDNPAIVPSWAMTEEIMVTWDDMEAFGLYKLPHVVRGGHHTDWVRIIPYPEALGVEMVAQEDWNWREAKIDDEVLPTCSRLVEAIIKFLLDTDRVSLGHYLEVVAPR
jgi:hypothetical protein